MEKVYKGARIPPHPPAHLDVAPGIISAGFYLQEVETCRTSWAWGVVLGHGRYGMATVQPWDRGFPDVLRQ